MQHPRPAAKGLQFRLKAGKKAIRSGGGHPACLRLREGACNADDERHQYVDTQGKPEAISDGHHLNGV